MAASPCKADGMLTLTSGEAFLPVTPTAYTLCRSVLAEAIFAELLAGAPQLDVSAESASVGPAFAGGHDERVVDAAAAAGIALLPRRPRAFDEAIDIVAFDLVLVMDHFDCEDVRAPRRPAGCKSCALHMAVSFCESKISVTCWEIIPRLQVIETVACSCSLHDSLACEAV